MPRIACVNCARKSVIKFYFDTSALLPYYRQETSSDAIQALLSEQTRPVLISQLVTVEFASALARWVRMQELTEPQAHRIESALCEDIAEGRFLIRPVEPRHFERAYHWLLARKTSLRTLDALQLACSEENRASLVTLDAAMYSTAEFLGLNLFDVLSCEP